MTSRGERVHRQRTLNKPGCIWPSASSSWITSIHEKHSLLIHSSPVCFFCLFVCFLESGTVIGWKPSHKQMLSHVTISVMVDSIWHHIFYPYLQCCLELKYCSTAVRYIIRFIVFCVFREDLQRRNSLSQWCILGTDIFHEADIHCTGGLIMSRLLRAFSIRLH